MRQRRSEAGITVMEVVITMLLISIITGGLFAFLASTSTLSKRANDQSIMEQDGQVALRRMLQDLRAANPIVSTCTASGSGFANSTTVSNYASCVMFEIKGSPLTSSGCPKELVTYGLVGSHVKVSKVAYNSSCTPTTTLSAVEVVPVVNTGSTPLFEYYDTDGAPVALSGTFPDRIGSVKVTLRLKANSTSSTRTLSSYASLRNSR